MGNLVFKGNCFKCGKQTANDLPHYTCLECRTYHKEPTTIDSFVDITSHSGGRLTKYKDGFNLIHGLSNSFIDYD